MRNSTLLKWTQNASNNKNQPSKNGGVNRNWIHPPDALQKGHIAYLVKYLGNIGVDEPKGIQVVQDAICKLKFNQQIKKSEGTKTPKVELTISIDGVAIQEPKTKTSPKRIMHQYPLHRISYCADDKSENKFFSFIAKEEERHSCFVFISDKLAAEIALTIGQAFDLAYKRFLETSGKDLEMQRRGMVLHQKIKRLENENNIYRQRLQDVVNIKGLTDISAYLTQHNIPDILHIPEQTISTAATSLVSESKEFSQINGSGKLLIESKRDINENACNELEQPPPVPPRSFKSSSDDNGMSGELMSNQSLNNDNKMKDLTLDDDDEEDFNPRAYENESNGVGSNQSGKDQFSTRDSPRSNVFSAQYNGSVNPPPLLAPPPKSQKDSRRQQGSTTEDLFGSVPFNPMPICTSNIFNDPFEMGKFEGSSVNASASQQDLENAIGLLDKRILEMKDGFSRGLSMGTDDFSLESLDPLRN